MMCKFEVNPIRNEEVGVKNTYYKSSARIDEFTFYLEATYINIIYIKNLKRKSL
jgi:hypothetical protein